MAKKKAAEAADTKFKRYDDNQRNRGMVKIHMWVPEDDRERALKYGGRLRKAYAKKLEA